MASRPLNVAMIGYKFMGRAHSQAWRNSGLYFDLPATPVQKVVCGRNRQPLQAFAERWGWQETCTDWQEVVARDDVDIVDIATPTYLHHPIGLAAAAAGKHIFCEKPFCLNSGQAEQLLAAAERHGVTHYLNHNYRRCPAVALAKQMIDEGKIGRIFHWRGCYLQSWIVDPDFPLTWQLRQEAAGSGPQADLNSHSVDLSRFLVGEISSVMALTASFVPERPLPDEVASEAFAGSSQGTSKGRVTVEDAATMIVEFANGALGSFEASRFATGRKNFNSFEIYGDRGSLIFNLERMNELEYFSRDDAETAQGFRTILVTEPNHPYISAWWPPGHIIGYEHEFTHAVVDFVRAVAEQTPIRPNFEDGLKVMQVLDAGLQSAETGQRVQLGIR